MFGYITPTKSNLTKEDIEKYRAYYCGLCHELKEKYGKEGSSALSYDMVFLSLLLTDLYNVDVKEGSEKCIAKPFKEHKYITSTYTEYAAAMQILLSYYSELDKVKDKDADRDGKKLKNLEKFIPQLKEKYPRQCNALIENLNILSKGEEEGEKDAGKMSYIFGLSLSEIFNPIENDFFSTSLKHLGLSLGRFIYLMDAYEDRKKDEKANAYNPLIKMEEGTIDALLINAATDASAAFEALALDDNLAILRNIIYSGMWKTKDKDKDKKDNNDRRSI